jgi:hypothetical protein
MVHGEEYTGGLPSIALIVSLREGLRTRGHLFA